MADIRHTIVKNVADLLHDGDFVNLGVGIPTLVSLYLPDDVTVLLHAENGCIGQDRVLVGGRASYGPEWYMTHSDDRGNWQDGHMNLINAGGEFITLMPGSSCFDSALSFGMVRGGHLDVTVLGALQVDSSGNIANWMVPKKMLNGPGGAMDLVSGAKKVIVAMEHCDKHGNPKILKKCTMPLTGIHCVNTIVTEKCVLEVEDGKLLVTAMAPGLTREELTAVTEAELTFPQEIREMKV